MATSPDPIRLPMVAPVVSAIGGGTVSAEKIGTWSNADRYPPDDAMRSEQEWWKFVATPNPGWIFDRMEIAVTWTNSIAPGSASKTVTDPIYRSYWGDWSGWEKPGEPLEPDTDGRFFMTTNAGGIPDREDGLYYPAWGYNEIQPHAFYTASFEVTAFFKLPHGHGLIYSPSRDLLIYDLTSNRLMYYP